MGLRAWLRRRRGGEARPSFEEKVRADLEAAADRAAEKRVRAAADSGAADRASLHKRLNELAAQITILREATTALAKEAEERENVRNAREREAAASMSAAEAEAAAAREADRKAATEAAAKAEAAARDASDRLSYIGKDVGLLRREVDLLLKVFPAPGQPAPKPAAEAAPPAPREAAAAAGAAEAEPDLFGVQEAEEAETLPARLLRDSVLARVDSELARVKDPVRIGEVKLPKLVWLATGFGPTDRTGLSELAKARGIRAATVNSLEAAAVACKIPVVEIGGRKMFVRAADSIAPRRDAAP